MIRKIARFFLWEHLTATLWVSAVIIIVVALNYFGLIYPALESHLDVKTYRIIDGIVGPIGLLALAIFVLGFGLYRRRRHDRQTGNTPPQNR
jgi:uncharacterized membrane protein YhaH (DUF805 family)